VCIHKAVKNLNTWTYVVDKQEPKKYTGYNKLTKNGKLAINPYTTEA